ncbi:CCA tRNA nucleotidyltransferase [Gemella cuniculi]|uniref:CCA tRNA nucleotidyltransferase n=1 Tax=Gemella cuniculi TaxID=150240 RepID=UPI000414D9D8|nr:CCA tRNA nucleotidyltransferase [Gemella cuniculi]
MKTNNFKKTFGKAVDILKIFEKNGYEAYFVGGCVRDYILDINFSDIDITTNALPEEIKSIFNKTIDTGIKHGTVTIFYKGTPYEVTTFRVEKEYTNHRSPDKVEFVSNLKEDLDRRDFSINAMALDSNGNLYDYHNGKQDLNNKLIKTVNKPSDRFFEDALRMLRAFRFSSKLNFEIEEETLNAIEENAKLIEFVSVERIVAELKKLLKGVGNYRSLKLLLKSGIGNYIPFIKNITNYREFSNFTFCQSIYYLSYFNNIPLSEMKKLKLSNKEIVQIKNYNKIQSEFENGVPLELILYKNSKEDVIFISDLFGYSGVNKIKNTSLIITSFSEVKITSKEIIEIVNLKPGPWIKKVMNDIVENILLEKMKNNKIEIVDFLLRIRDNI